MTGVNQFLSVKKICTVKKVAIDSINYMLYSICLKIITVEDNDDYMF